MSDLKRNMKRTKEEVRKESNMEEEGRPTKVIKAGLRLYPVSHRGIASVLVQIKREHIRRNNKENLILMSKEVFKLNSGAYDLKACGFNKAEVFFYTKEQANRFTEKINEENENRVMEAFIPIHKLERKGIIRDFSLDYDVQDTILYAKSPAKILYVKRLERRVMGESKSDRKWIPSESIVMTFEGDVIPEEIKLYGLYSVKVQCFIEPVRKCTNCWSYGHSRGRCNGKTKCICNGELHIKGEACEKGDNIKKCIHCKEEHFTFNGQCPEFKFNRQINEYRALNNVSVFQAKIAIKEKYGNVSNNAKMTRNFSPKIQITKENFPEISKTTLQKTLELRRIGGNAPMIIGGNDQTNDDWG
ncbi:uncharacterized protein LOC143362241 [Halictus rubicundus]|uniref:uncharacterized protein LOC143362241 n=1 Tax=Halictus rubicundus TaxID=77578 RepID=UPI004036CFDF